MDRNAANHCLRLNRLALCVTIAWLLQLPGATPSRADWLQFRGSDGNALGDLTGDYPVEWDIETGSGIAWQVDLPGKGPSSPIVVGDRVIVTCSSGYHQDRLHVLCFDVMSGAKLWERQFWATGRTITHEASANAAPTPASDGEAIYAFYSSNDLICLELDGRLRWYRGLAHDFPRAGNDVGMSSSPVVVDGAVIVQVENQGDSFAMGVDVQQGQTLWRVDRTPAANWSSPIALHDDEGQAAALLKSGEGITALHARTGSQLWHVDLPAGGITSITKVGTELITPANGLVALDTGELTQKPATLWTAGDVQPGPATPVAVGDALYAINRAGVLACVDRLSGAKRWQLRLRATGKERGSFWASPVVAGGHLYCINDQGVAYVVHLGDQGTIAAANSFGESIQATPAVVDGSLIVRGSQHLWKVARP